MSFASFCVGKMPSLTDSLFNSLPSLSPYIGTKGFDVSFSRSVYNEMAVEKAQVDVVCIAPGQVVSGMNSGPATIMVNNIFLL